MMEFGSPVFWILWTPALLALVAAVGNYFLNDKEKES